MTQLDTLITTIAYVSTKQRPLSKTHALKHIIVQQKLDTVFNLRLNTEDFTFFL